MQILTPTGYRDITDCVVGDEVRAFDTETGAPIINTIELIQQINEAEYDRWWNGQTQEVDFPWRFFLINGLWTLNSEQSIWRATPEGPNICHVRDLILGDTIYDDADHNVIITNIEEISASYWWRLEISGDHSYIADGLLLHNASRFWVLGTGSWDTITTTHWATSSGAGSGGASVPGVSDTATFDGGSGGGTVTLNQSLGITVQSITCGAFTGTLDNSANNNNVTLSAASAFSGSGTGTRTINLGNGIWNLTSTAAGTIWNMAVITNLTWSANSSTIQISGATLSALRIFAPGALSYNKVTFTGFCTISGTCTITTLDFAAATQLGLGSTITVTSTSLTGITNGTNAAPLLISNSQNSAQSTISVASGTYDFAWAGFAGIAFTGGATFTAENSFNFGHNSGITITPPTMTRSRGWSGMA
jgi:hypothetical protein